MKLYATLMTAWDLSIKIVVSPKKGLNPDEDKPLLGRYTAKSGKESLIFDPAVSLQIVKTDYNKSGQLITVPINLSYFLGTMFATVYNSLKDKKLYTESSTGELMMDKSIAIKHSRKISIYTDFLTISPGLGYDKSSKLTPIINIGLTDTIYGFLYPSEVKHLISILDHIDIPSLGLLSSLCDQVVRIDKKSDIILDKLDKIESILTNNKHEAPEVTKEYDWKVSDGFL